MAKEGILFLIVPFLLAIAVLLLKVPYVSYPLAILLAILTVYFAFFFRDPPRNVSAAVGDWVSPVDGTVIDVLDEGDNRRLIVFLSIFNVHVTRLPFAGTVTKMDYFKGEFLPAYREKASELNERITLTIESDGFSYRLRLIAGIAARRIRMWVGEGSRLKTGDKIGIILFGSRAELIFPKTVELFVKKNDKLRGGLTLIGKRAQK